LSRLAWLACAIRVPFGAFLGIGDIQSRDALQNIVDVSTFAFLGGHADFSNHAANKRCADLRATPLGKRESGPA
jgi:hypothetical protein